jgi:hypothetical protein
VAGNQYVQNAIAQRRGKFSNRLPPCILSIKRLPREVAVPLDQDDCHFILLIFSTDLQDIQGIEYIQNIEYKFNGLILGGWSIS